MCCRTVSNAFATTVFWEIVTGNRNLPSVAAYSACRCQTQTPLPRRSGTTATTVRRQLFLRIDDNYFSRSTTITPCPAGGAKRRCQTSLEMSPLAPSRRPRGFIHKIGFFPAAAGGRGGGKVGILVLDFHFSTAHNSRFFACPLFCLRHVTPAISTALPPSGFSWWRRPPPHSPSAWLSAC